MITVIAEVRSAARQLEADQNQTLPRAPDLLPDLDETRRLLCQNIVSNKNSFYETSTSNRDVELGTVNTLQNTTHAAPSIPSFADHCRCRSEVREIQLHRRHARGLALELVYHTSDRLGTL